MKKHVEELKEMLSVDLLELSTMKLEETKFSVKDLFPEAVKKHANQDSNLKVQYNVGDADADNVIISESFAKKIPVEHPIDVEKEVIDNKIQAMRNCKMNEPYMASSKSDNMSAGKAIVDEFLSLGHHAEVTPEIELSKSAQEMASVDLCELNAMQTEEARFLHSSHYVTATDERITYPETPLVLQAFNNTDADLTSKSITEIYSIKR